MLKNQPSIDDAIKGNHILLMTDTSVTMVVTQKSAYRVVRVLNHWIKHLLKQHEGHDQEEAIDSNAIWYRRWTTLYKSMRSSKRSFRELYEMWTNDYSQNAPTPFSLIMDMVNTIPKLRQCYDIEYLEFSPNDPNNFKLTVQLYFFEDNENRYAAAASHPSFVPFLDNTSLVTMKTSESDIGSMSNASSNIDENDETKLPETITVNEKIGVTSGTDVDTQAAHDGDDMEKMQLFSKLSTIPEDITVNKGIKSGSSPKDSDLSYDTDSKLDRKDKYNKKTNELREVVALACKDTIKDIAAHATEDITTVTSVLKQQTQLLQQLLISSTSTNSNPTVTPAPVTSSNRYTNMPSPRQTSTNPSSSTHPTSSFQTPQHKNNPSRTSQIPFQRAGVIIFTYDGAQYELNDTHFHKYSSELLPVRTKSDLIVFYNQLQSMAVLSNIFLSPFENLVPWNKSPSSIPTTCLLQSLSIQDNTVEAYRRMKSALYTKITKSTILNQQYKAIVSHHSTTQDGFEVLYDLCCHCHPKLVIATSRVRDTNPRPVMRQEDTIYTYIKSLETWVKVNEINGVNHNDMQMIDIVMEELRNDSRYDQALIGITNQLTMMDTYNRQFNRNDFPESLLVSNLPSTVMSYYSDAEKQQLFPPTTVVNKIVDSTSSSSTSDICDAIINSIKNDKSLTRKMIDELCEGCGKFGHDVFQNGCDFCAQLLIARNFLESNPKSAASILRNYKTHQNQRQKNRNDKNSGGRKEQRNSEKKPRYNFRSRQKAKIKQLTNDMINALKDDDDNASEENSFHDANESVQSESLQDSAE